MRLCEGVLPEVLVFCSCFRHRSLLSPALLPLLYPVSEGPLYPDPVRLLSRPWGKRWELRPPELAPLICMLGSRVSLQERRRGGWG